MLKNYIILMILVVFALQTKAQQLLSPTFSYSHKKTAYITLQDGSEIKGNIKDVDRKKGLVDYVKIEDGKGKKHKLDASDIKFMYLAPSGFDKLNKMLDVMTDAQKWTDEKLEQDLLTQGYVYLENTQVKIKKKEFTLLMQLLNPSFSKEVKVYHDPYAKETASLGIGGITVAGGNEKSYFVQIGEDAAYKLTKKDYKKEFEPLWKSCKKVKAKYPDGKWKDLTEHILLYSECK